MNPEENFKDGSSARKAKRNRITLGPSFEAEVSLLLPHQRRALARQFYRWSKELWMSAETLDREANKKPFCRPIPRRKLALN